MTFLPIVERELRVAAKRRSTYKVRLWVGILGALFSCFLLVAGQGGAGWIGSAIFSVLAGLALLYCLLEGVRNAADSISEEKREGTLGLLLLTDLRNYDVVLGKLASVSIRAFHGLFAFIPILAIALILGGITGGEFWRVSVVLICTLFLSLCVGVFVSTISQSASRAQLAALGIMVAIAFLPGLFQQILALFKIYPSVVVQDLFSPILATRAARDAIYRIQPASFWLSLLSLVIMAWVFLLGASFALPRFWNEAAEQAGSRSWWKDRLPLLQRLFEGKLARAGDRSRLLDINPFCWLASRREGPKRILWWMLGLEAVLMAVEFVFSGAVTVSSAAIQLGGAAFKIAVAFQAAWHLAEARRNGALELLLSTPLQPAAIVDGLWRSLQHMFFFPLIAYLALWSIAIHISLLAQPTGPPALFEYAAMMGLSGLGGLTFVVNLLAIAWLGTWMGISQRKPNVAVMKTVAIGFIAPIILMCIPTLIISFVLLRWSMSKVRRNFHRTVAEQFVVTTNESLPPRPNVPPLIAAG